VIGIVLEERNGRCSADPDRQIELPGEDPGGRMAAVAENVIKMNNICKSYRLGDGQVPVLKHVGFTVGKGESSSPSWAPPVPAKRR
jgi:hypothetical protein